MSSCYHFGIQISIMLKVVNMQRLKAINKKCSVIYNEKTKIWTNPLSEKFEKITLGERILNKLTQCSPEKLIEVNYDNGKRLIASDLKVLTMTIAENLVNLGIIKNDVILFFGLMNSLTTPIVFACYTIGVAICPMELMLGDDDTKYIVNQLNPSVIIYDENFENRVRPVVGKLKLQNLKYLICTEYRNDGQCVQEMLCMTIKSNSEFQVPTNLGSPDEIVAAIVLTSGSTGCPKAICISHSLLGFGSTTWWTLDSNSIVYIASPFRWISQISAMLMPIFTDTARVFTSQTATPELCSNLIKTIGVTNFFSVSGLVVNILRYVESQKIADNFKSLKYILTGGERITKALDELTQKLVPHCRLIKAYGMTELGGCISTNEFVDDEINSSGNIRPGISMKILGENGDLLGPNQNGQICVKIFIPFLKYLKNDKANSESFLCEGWFSTGDYGRIDQENNFFPLNRYQDLIKFENYVIIPSVLEAVLENHPALEASFVVGLPNSTWGEIPVIFCKLKSSFVKNGACNNDLKNDIKNFLLNDLPTDNLTPEHIFLIDTFPNTTCGKVDKMKLKIIASESLVN